MINLTLADCYGLHIISSHGLKSVADIIEIYFYLSPPAKRLAKKLPKVKKALNAQKVRKVRLAS